jgi:5-methylcytosine-specific restriction endonuclease McrA
MIKKNRHWENIVGYSLQELIDHFENTSDFTVQDYLEKDLHIDHIIPISAYDFNSFEDEEFKKCWNLRNLRLITAKENLSKSNKLDIKLIEEYNIINLLPLKKN